MEPIPDSVFRTLRTLALAILPTILLGPLTFYVWKESKERDTLESTGVTTVGKILSHSIGNKACRSSVEVEYSVLGARHTVNGVSSSCLYHQGNLLVGRTVSVRYVKTAPAIADVIAPLLEIEDNRLTWFSIFPLIFSMLFSWWAAYETWIKKEGEE